jgi:hypothetical protein
MSSTSGKEQEMRSPLAPFVTRAALCVFAGVALFFALAGIAGASVEVGVDAHNATLRVDAAGNAQVSWVAAGVGHSVLIARDGSLRFGGGLEGPDVSHPATLRLPWQVTVRQTSDGSYYALQSWRRLDSGPVELRFSRWSGAPTKLTLTTVCCKWGSLNVGGAASFHGRPIFGYSATPRGAPLDPFGRNVYLDTLQGTHWTRMMGILTHRPTGTFSLWIRPEWRGTDFRGTIPGPNWGWTLGPDAAAETGEVHS